ncbi:MAG: hypothetical protein AB1486_18380 [Planctomycetota bacterium]
MVRLLFRFLVSRLGAAGTLWRDGFRGHRRVAELAVTTATGLTPAGVDDDSLQRQHQCQQDAKSYHRSVLVCPYLGSIIEP